MNELRRPQGGREEATPEDFRATAAAFSQLTGVLGGFSIAFLILTLDSELLGKHRSAQDWVVGLTLSAALSYIYSAGILANSMNVATFQATFRSRGVRPRGGMAAVQMRVFNHGIIGFHVGNLLLAAAIIIAVYQYSLTIGIIATVAVALVTVYVAFFNLGVPVLIYLMTRRMAAGSSAAVPPVHYGSSSSDLLGEYSDDE